MIKMEKEQKQKRRQEQQIMRQESHAAEEQMEQHRFRSQEPEKEPYVPVRAGVLSQEEAARAKEVLAAEETAGEAAGNIAGKADIQKENVKKANTEKENIEKEYAEEETIRNDMVKEDAGTGDAKVKAAEAGADRKIRYKLSEGLKMRKVAGQTMIVPIGSAVRTIGQTAVLNPEAAFLVSQMKEWFTPEEVVRKGLEVYDADEDKLRADVMKLVETLFQSGMLIEDTEDGRGKRGRASGIVRVPAGKDLPGPGSL